MSGAGESPNGGFGEGVVHPVVPGMDVDITHGFGFVENRVGGKSGIITVP
ncbi:hypothetical protein NSND_63482 [Nitrospira sp. ND1]|nr:hypothetical protein NSND_63482 [Nitrospira sp. ND1]